MKKILVEVGNLESFICQDSAKIYVDNSMILTPGAKDELSKRKIEIVRGSKPDTTVCEAAEHGTEGFERFVLTIAVMLKEQFGINDPEQLQILSYQVAKTVKENI
ncbi:hypothetical protein [Desulfovibrio gilichinskyi]|uniref:Uncharacterized protein n=1 Tax=Desulfovibrio gilichinskyi TaxID=1519643 RepID=A0A1X7E9P6_9BACT|nr:hypothetical protein [Desulfovibrio gilichinskyi]SMF29755.1 hypothetical protein SAMN06295933_2796 [Desulfovibrio gilichinskyi]